MLVPRNTFWFENNVPALQKIWDTIERERVEGWEHRAPKKRNAISVKKESGGSETPDWFSKEEGPGQGQEEDMDGEDGFGLL